MKTQIITDLCRAINAIEHRMVEWSTWYKDDLQRVNRLTKHMVEIAKDLRKDRNVNLGKLNKALEKAGWVSKEFVVVKKRVGACWWNELKLVDIK